MKRFAFSSLLLLAAIGCGGNSTPETAQTSSPTPANAPAANPTQASVVANGASTEPGEVVAVFLDSLRRGDEKAANGVLTSLAQESLAKTDYAIDPVGTADGKFTIGRVGFVDGDTSTGLVECVWTEPNPDPTQPALEMEIVCEVHKEPQGWRISGMAVKLNGNEDPFVRDFEDPQSLQQALGGGAPPAQAPANVAQGVPPQGLPQGVVPAGTVSSDLGLPGSVTAGQPTSQFPPAPTGAQPGQFPPAPSQDQPPTQIAFPPTPNVNR